jgi:hypothetical protein
VLGSLGQRGFQMLGEWRLTLNLTVVGWVTIFEKNVALGRLVPPSFPFFNACGTLFVEHATLYTGTTALHRVAFTVCLN